MQYFAGLIDEADVFRRALSAAEIQAIFSDGGAAKPQDSVVTLVETSEFSPVRTVVSGNSAPTAEGDAYSLNEDGALAVPAPGVLGNDSDPDGDPLTAVLVSGPSSGALTLNADGSFSYTPNADFNGDDSFTYKANDGSLDSSAATVAITVDAVNDPPSFTKGPNQAIDEDAGPQTLADWAADISAGPANEADQVLEFLVSNDNHALFAVQPALTADGALTYTSAPDANGSATVTVTLKDNGGTANGGQDTSAAQTFTITVNAVNDAPVNTVPGAQSTDEDISLVFSSANGNRLSIADVDADEGTGIVEVSLAATNGTLTLSSTAELSFTAGDGIADSTMTFTGALGAVNTALDGLSFIPNPNFSLASGLADLTITTDDLGNTGAGGALSDSDTVGIAVFPVADTPNLAVEPASGDEGSPIPLSITASLNDTDGSETLSITISDVGGNMVLSAGTNEGGGTWSLTLDQLIGLTITVDDNGVFDLTVTATAKEPGSTASTSASLAVTVANVAPTADFANGGAVDEGLTGSVSFTNQWDPSMVDRGGLRYAYDFDNDGVFDLGDGTHAGSSNSDASVTVPAHYFFDGPGSRTVRGRILDKDGGFSDYTTAITINNIAPTASFTNTGAADEGSTGSVSFANQWDPSPVDDSAGFRYAYDFDDDGVFDLGDGGYAGGVTEDSATVPAQYLADGPGSRTVRGRILDKDGGFSDYTAVITVNNVAPTADFTNAGAVDEGSSGSVSFANQWDPSPVDTGAGFRYAYDFDNDGVFDLGDGGYAGGVTESLATVPANHLAEGPGSRTIRGRILDKDGGFSDYTTTITINNVVPTAAITGAPASVNERDLVQLGGSFTDPGSADTHTFRWQATSSNGQVIADGAGQTFSFTPNDNGAYTVTFTVTDDDGGAGSNTVVITVDNLAPTLSNVAITSPINENDLATLSGAISDPGTQDTFTLEVNWGDGSPVETFSYAAGTTSFSETHRYLDDDPTGTSSDTYTVTLQLADDDGGVRAIPSPPPIFNDPPYYGEVQIQFYEPLGQTFIATASGLESIAFFVSDSNANFAPNDFAIEMDLYAGWGTDGLLLGTREFSGLSNGFSGFAEFDFDGIDLTLGATYTAIVRNDSVRWFVRVSLERYPEGTALLNGSATTLLVGRPASDYDLGFRIQWASSGAPPVAVVKNVAPAVAITGSPASSPEGTAISLATTVTDPGSADTHTYEWRVTTLSGATYASGTGSDFVFTPDDNGLYTVTFTATDDDGGSGSQSKTIGVSNVPPVIALPGTVTTASEGASYILELGPITDPGRDGVSAYKIHWGDGASEQFSGSPVGESKSHQYLDGAAAGTSHTITVDLFDEDGWHTNAGSRSITVHNVAPIVTAASDQRANPGISFAIDLGGFTDPGADSPWAVEVDWGDGSADTAFNSDAAGPLGTRDHTYALNGDYTVTVQVTDKDGASDNKTFTVTVAYFTFQAGSTGHDAGHSIATDAAGNVYVTGSFRGTVDFDPGDGTVNLTSAGNSDIFVAKYSPAGVLLWAKAMGGAFVDEGFAVSVDPAGSVYTTGHFYETADFDPGSAVYNLTSVGQSDVFVSKLNARGDFVWAKRMGGSRHDDSWSLAVDSSGDIYTTGAYSGTADFDPDPALSYDLTSTGGSDIFVAKLSRAGDFVWARRMGSGTGSDVGYDLAVDGDGNVHTIGFFAGTADFDPGPGSYNLTSAGQSDVFVSKLSAGGHFVWAKRLGGRSKDIGGAITIDRAGQIYTAGYFYGTVDFDPDPAVTYNLTSAGMTDVFVSKLNAGGNFAWAKRIGGAAFEIGSGLVVDGRNVYVSGSFHQTVDLDPGAGIYSVTSAGQDDVFVSKLDTEGAFVWAKHIGGRRSDSPSDLAVDNRGSLYSTGSFNGTADFDPGLETYNLTSAGQRDVFVLKLSPSGGNLAQRASGGEGQGAANAPTLTPKLLQPIVAEAIAHWHAAAVDPERLRALDQVEFVVTDLPEAHLGLASSSVVWIDRNAAGWGWFIDPTPTDDREFSTLGNQGEKIRIDLLTTVMHELGHVLGYGDLDPVQYAGELMSATLPSGARRLPLSGQIVEQLHDPGPPAQAAGGGPAPQLFLDALFGGAPVPAAAPARSRRANELPVPAPQPSWSANQPAPARRERLEDDGVDEFFRRLGETIRGDEDLLLAADSLSRGGLLYDHL